MGHNLTVYEILSQVNVGSSRHSHFCKYTLFLCAETLNLLIAIDDQAAAAAEPVISPLLLNIWALNVSDPFISFDSLDTLEVRFNYCTFELSSLPLNDA